MGEQPRERHSLSPSRRVIRKMNELYIQTRKKYLIQTPQGYSTMDRDKSDRVWMLNDGMIKRHLKGDITYGVFSGGYFNKFLTFDVDYKDNTDYARWVTLKLIDTLLRDFHIDRNNIHVSLSGNKGYHIDLFFDKPIQVTESQLFYKNVMEEVGTLPKGGEVEFRPTWTQGVKLPLGIHQSTGDRCWYVDNQTLEPIESFDYILDIEPMDASIITDIDFGLTLDQSDEFERVVDETDTAANLVDMSKALEQAHEIIKTGRLVASGTRHKTTYILAMFGNMHGWEREETVAVIMDVLLGTPREYFSKGSTPEYWHKEAVRLVDYAYDNDKVLGMSDKPVEIYKSEIISILQVGTFRQKQLAYAMLVTSKRYGRVFYLTRSTAKQMLGVKSNQTIQSAVAKLVERGFIEYTRRNELDYALTLELGRVRHKPNKYRLLINEPSEDEPFIEVDSSDSIVDIAHSLCTVDEIRQYVKEYEFTNRWKQ